MQEKKEMGRGGGGRGNEKNGKGRTNVGTNGEVMGEMQEERGRGMSAAVTFLRINSAQ